MRYILLLILLLLLALAGYGYTVVMGYQSPQNAGNQRMQMEVANIAAGPVQLENISLDVSFFVSPTDYPTDLPSILKQRPRIVRIGAARFAQKKTVVAAHNVALTFTPSKNERHWEGMWALEKLETENLPYPLPAMQGEGTFVLNENNVMLKGTLHDAPNTHTVSFIAQHDMRDASKSSVELTGGHLPFEGGKLRLEKGMLIFGGKNLFTGVIIAENILVGNLLEALMEGRVSASGNVSGTLPVTVRQSGVPIVKGAVLTAAQGGIIKLQPGAIPAGNEQLTMVSDVLSNFNYNSLDIKLSSGADEKLSAALTVEGNNPDMYNGRKVKLNVHLGGDLLSLIQHSVLSLTDPKALLEKEQHEEH